MAKLKKLKRYQYERYAILCRLAYPNNDIEQYPLSEFGIREIFDRWGRPTVRVFWQAHKEEVIVVFRGSLSLSDWLTNLYFVPVTYQQGEVKYKIHAGYQRLLSQISCPPDRVDTIKTVEQEIIDTLTPLVEQGKRVSLTGHSSGGAMSVLLADRLERRWHGCIKRVVTFGQPSCGLWSFKRGYCLHRRTYRVVCDLDVVSFLPPLPMVYWHVGRMLWLHNEKIYENTSAVFRFSKSLLSWLMMPISYHFMRKYIRNKDLFDEH
ncbi:lipase family protein [Aliagarivorans marinus]|uniref:lipase family protein n=1 Tax=Aliagarivorans marinus TaxID=561965 RepID=UPI000424B9CE|nr:lipase [Aliagarivorans marinus]